MPHMQHVVGLYLCFPEFASRSFVVASEAFVVRTFICWPSGLSQQDDFAFLDDSSVMGQKEKKAKPTTGKLPYPFPFPVSWQSASCQAN